MLWLDAPLHTLTAGGRCAMADGHAPQAEILLRQALEIVQANGAANARPLTELDARTSPRLAG